MFHFGSNAHTPKLETCLVSSINFTITCRLAKLLLLSDPAKLSELSVERGERRQANQSYDTPFTPSTDTYTNRIGEVIVQYNFDYNVGGSSWITQFFVRLRPAKETVFFVSLVIRELGKR